MYNGTQPDAPPALPAPVAQTSGTTVAMSREMEQMRMIFMLSQERNGKRNEVEILAEIEAECTDLELAKEALYSYSRGGQVIEGPTIDLMEVVSRVWGRVGSGWEMVSRQYNDAGVPVATVVRAWACDYQTLRPDSREFIVDHIRETKKGGYLIIDSRDVYELIANQAQRRKRACLEALIPLRIVRAAISQCQETIANAGDKPFPERVAGAIKAFERFGVTLAIIEKFFACRQADITPHQYIRLTAIFKSLKDGMAQATDFFDMGTAAPAGSETVDVQPQPQAQPEPPKPAEKEKNKGGRGKKKDADAAGDSPQSEVDTSALAAEQQAPTETPPPQQPQPAAEQPSGQATIDWGSMFGS